jgi:hypothetical protein
MLAERANRAAAVNHAGHVGRIVFTVMLNGIEFVTQP